MNSNSGGGSFGTTVSWITWACTCRAEQRWLSDCPQQTVTKHLGELIFPLAATGKQHQSRHPGSCKDENN